MGIGWWSRRLIEENARKGRSRRREKAETRTQRTQNGKKMDGKKMGSTEISLFASGRSLLDF